MPVSGWAPVVGWAPDVGWALPGAVLPVEELPVAPELRGAGAGEGAFPGAAVCGAAGLAGEGRPCGGALRDGACGGGGIHVAVCCGRGAGRAVGM